MKPLTKLTLAAAVLAPLPALAAWEIEPTHTHISFAVGHLGLTKTPGFFRKFDTRLDFDDKNIETSKVTITIDAASIDTNFEQRDEHLRGADWFNVASTPKIVFASQSVRHIADNRYVIAGLLTIRGKTLPVEFQTVLTNRTVNPWMKVPVIGFAGSAKIKRSDFGLSGFLPAVADEVELNIQLEMMQKS
jgi:polyisoprenoid-binding protein YceI